MRFQLMIWWFEVGADETVGGGDGCGSNAGDVIRVGEVCV